MSMVQKIMEEYTGTMVYKYNTKTSIVEVAGIYLENVAGELLYSGYSEDYEKEGGSGLLMYNHYPALGYRKDNEGLFLYGVEVFVLAVVTLFSNYLYYIFFFLYQF